MNLAEILGAIASAIAIAAALWHVVRSLIRLIDAVQANTRAQGRLAGSLRDVSDLLLDHEGRLGEVERRLRIVRPRYVRPS